MIEYEGSIKKGGQNPPTPNTKRPKPPVGSGGFASLKDSITSTPEGRQLWLREKTVLDVTEMICEVMQREGFTRKKLCKAIGRTEGWLECFLDGQITITVDLISEILLAMGCETKLTGKVVVKIREKK